MVAFPGCKAENAYTMPTCFIKPIGSQVGKTLLILNSKLQEWDKIFHISNMSDTSYFKLHRGNYQLYFRNREGMLEAHKPFTMTNNEKDTPLDLQDYTNKEE
jgi:hypothetical protein